GTVLYSSRAHLTCFASRMTDGPALQPATPALLPPRSMCPRSPSFAGKAFASGEAARSGDCAGQAEEGASGKAPCLFKLGPSDVPFRYTGPARGLVQPFREILARPDCITHLLQV